MKATLLVGGVTVIATIVTISPTLVQDVRLFIEGGQQMLFGWGDANKQLGAALPTEVYGFLECLKCLLAFLGVMTLLMARPIWKALTFYWGVEAAGQTMRTLVHHLKD